MIQRTRRLIESKYICGNMRLVAKRHVQSDGRRLLWNAYENNEYLHTMND